MYLRLVSTEAAMANMAERRRQSEMIAIGWWIPPNPRDLKKPNGEG